MSVVIEPCHRLKAGPHGVFRDIARKMPKGNVLEDSIYDLKRSSRGRVLLRHKSLPEHDFEK